MYKHVMVGMVCAGLLALSGCNRASTPETATAALPPDSLPLPSAIAIAQALHQMPRAVLQRLAGANQPDAQGALGRNKAGYFHVRFQMGISALADYGCTQPDDTALHHTQQALRYSFAAQLPAGDFSLMVPSTLAHLGPPSAGDKASGVSFFLSAVAAATHLVSTTPVVQQHPIVSTVDSLRAAAHQALNWLVAQEALLLAYDQHAPNRLLFDAIAYCGLGQWLGYPAATQAGKRMLRLALQAQHSAGYFIEGGGYDSSYNGVCLANALRLLMLLPHTDPDVALLWQAIVRTARWQASRVLANGEISTAGNTRVRPGGEQFLGQEKGVAASTIWQAYHVLYAITQEAPYLELANRIEGHYAPSDRLKRR